MSEKEKELQKAVAFCEKLNISITPEILKELKRLIDFKFNPPTLEEC
jgi:hypothetical protein